MKHIFDNHPVQHHTDSPSKNVNTYLLFNHKTMHSGEVLNVELSLFFLRIWLATSVFFFSIVFFYVVINATFHGWAISNPMWKTQKSSSRHRQCKFDFCNLEISRQIEVVNHSTLKFDDWCSVTELKSKRLFTFYLAAKQQTSWVIATWWFSVPLAELHHFCFTKGFPKTPSAI